MTNAESGIETGDQERPRERDQDRDPGRDLGRGPYRSDAVDQGQGRGQDRGAQQGAPVARTRRIPVLLGVAVLAYGLDLLSKLWVVTSLEGRQPIQVVGSYLRLQAIRNGGAAFGFGQGMTIVFTIIAAGVIVVIFRIARKLHSLPWAIALGLLLGGALGNLTDRVFRSPGFLEGHVVDFIAPTHFAVFNLADSAIVCGGVLIVLLSFRGLDPDGTVHKE